MAGDSYRMKGKINWKSVPVTSAKTVPI